MDSYSGEKEIMLKGEVSKCFVTGDLLSFLWVPITFKMYENSNNDVWEEKGKIFSYLPTRYNLNCSKMYFLKHLKCSGLSRLSCSKDQL